MGTYTDGSYSAALSRELSEEEVAVWRERTTSYRPRVDGNGWGFSEEFNPERWDFDGELWGDVGRMEFDRDALRVEIGGKVYDVAHAIAVAIDALPAGVTAQGSGTFDSEGYEWGVLTEGRATRECEAERITLPSAVWVLNHWDDVGGEPNVLGVFLSAEAGQRAYDAALVDHEAPGCYLALTEEVLTR